MLIPFTAAPVVTVSSPGDDPDDESADDELDLLLPLLLLLNDTDDKLLFTVVLDIRQQGLKIQWQAKTSVVPSLPD